MLEKLPNVLPLEKLPKNLKKKQNLIQIPGEKSAITSERIPDDNPEGISRRTPEQKLMEWYPDTTKKNSIKLQGILTGTPEVTTEVSPEEFSKYIVKRVFGQTFEEIIK